MDPIKTILLIHGHGVDSSVWDPLYAALAPDYRLLKPDLSTWTTHETVEAYAEALLGLLEAAQVTRTTLIGHSMGGYIALAFAERYPDRVSGLVLFHSTAFADDAERAPKRQAAIRQLQQAGSAAFIDEVVPNMVADENRTALADELKHRVARGRQLPADALTAGIRAIAARPDRTHVLREAPFPILVIAGEADKLVPPEKSRAHAALLGPAGELVMLPKTGHLGMIEQPAASLRLIQAFMDRVQA